MFYSLSSLFCLYLEIPIDFFWVYLVFLSRTSTATTMYTFNNATFFEFRFWDTAYTVGTEICISCLNTTQTTKIFIARLFPFCYQVGISNFLGNAIIIQLSTDCLSSIKQIVDVSRFLMVYFENGPQRFVDTFSFMRIRFS